MVKIRIYIVFEMLVFAKANEVLQVTLCENYGQRNESVTCPENRTISLKSIVYGESRCKDSNNNLVCHSTLNTYFGNHCAGQNNCTLPIDILSNNSCQKPARRLKVTFECYRDDWLAFWLLDKRYTVDTCSETLWKVKCPSKYHMHIKYVESFPGESDCHNEDTSCAKGILNGLCNDKQRCLPDTTKTSCLVHERFASIYFVCKGHSDLLVTESLTNSSSVETTTIDAASATTETSDDNLPVFRIDVDHRVEIYYPSQNLTLSLCSVGWDDFDAGVLCKSLNRTWIGNASSVDKLLDIQTLPYSLHCSGLESSLSACKFTEDDNGCNTTTVAGATCCQGTGIPGECVLNLASEKSGFQTLASIHVTIMSALIVSIVAALLIILIVCYRRSRSEKLKPCQSQHNSTTTERTDSSNYNVINYSEMSNISMIKINEKRNEIPTIQHHLQNIKTSIKQNQNICTKNESLSTNQNSLEHIYESESIRNNKGESLTKQRELDKHTYESAELLQPPDIKTSMEQDQNICHKYETLSTNRNSDKHIYESDSIHTNQYESLTKPPVSDKHTYESTELTQPHDIEQDQHICIKYESLSTNRNSDKHIYESTHTNQYESLKKQQESDKHTYESTEHAQPHDIKISTDQEDNFCNKYESLSTNRNSVEHTYESTEQSLPVSQYQSLTNPQESDKHVYASTESPHYSA